MKSVLKSIENHLTALEKGTLDAEGLEAFVNQSRLLYEQAVVLQYKAYEKQVFGSVESESIPKSNENKEEIIVEKTFVSEPTTSELSSEIPIQFEPPVAEYEVHLTTEEPTVVQFVSQPTLDFGLPHEEEKTVEREELTSSRLDHLNAHVQNVSEDLEESKLEVVQEFAAPSTVDNGSSMLHSKFGVIDELFFKRIGHTRLTALQQSFPLNDRMLFIRELFQGSGEKFSEALTHLDAAAGYSEALEVAAGYAHTFGWDLESSTVNGFVNMIKRRHG